MSKKYSSVSMVFLKTLILTTVLLSTTVFLLSFFIEKTDEKEVQNIVSEAEKLPKNPDNSLNMTTLMILCENGEKSGTTFVLARFLSEEEKIYLLPLPSDMMCQSGTEKLSAYEFFRRYGVEKSVKAISETLNIQIEKYVFSDNTGFATLADVISGGAEYEIPIRTEYYNEALSEYVLIEKGKQTLSGNEIRQYLSSPSFSEKFRSEQSAFLLAKVISSENGDYLSFLENINLYDDFLSHNFSYEEFSVRAEAIKKIKEKDKNPVTVIFPVGRWEGGFFYPSTEFKNYLSEKLDIRKLAEISDGY